MACLPSNPPPKGPLRKALAYVLVERKKSCPQTLMGVLCSNPHRPPHLIIMNWWCMIISGLIVVVLKIVGVTLFLLYCEYLSNLLPQLHVVLFLDLFSEWVVKCIKCPSLSTWEQLTIPFSLPKTHNGPGSLLYLGDIEMTQNPTQSFHPRALVG